MVVKITYSIATEEELESLVRFLSDPSIDESFVRPLSQRPQGIRDRVYDKFKRGYWLLALNEDDRENLFGCLALIPNNNEVEISTYAVAKRVRGQGIGSTLIDKAIELRKDKYPGKTLIMDSWEGNPAVERLMSKKGFIVREMFEDPGKRPHGVKTIVYEYKE